MLAPSCQRCVRYILPVLLIYGVLPGPALGWHVAESLLDEDDGARSAASAEIRQQATYPTHANTGQELLEANSDSAGMKAGLKHDHDMQRTKDAWGGAIHDQQDLPWWQVSNSSSFRGERRELLTSSSYSYTSASGREYFSCLQWPCVPGYISLTVPNCYFDAGVPSDDHTEEEGDYDECSDDVCCSATETDVYSCLGYPWRCPGEVDKVLAPCTWYPTGGFSECANSLCCGVPTQSPTMVPSPGPTGEPTRPPSFGPKMPTPTPDTISPTEAPTSTVPISSWTPVTEPPTMRPTMPTRTPDTMSPTEAPTSTVPPSTGTPVTEPPTVRPTTPTPTPDTISPTEAPTSTVPPSTWTPETVPPTTRPTTLTPVPVTINPTLVPIPTTVAPSTRSPETVLPTPVPPTTRPTTLTPAPVTINPTVVPIPTTVPPSTRIPATALPEPVPPTTRPPILTPAPVTINPTVVPIPTTVEPSTRSPETGPTPSPSTVRLSPGPTTTPLDPSLPPAVSTPEPTMRGSSTTSPALLVTPSVPPPATPTVVMPTTMEPTGLPNFPPSPSSIPPQANSMQPATSTGAPSSEGSVTASRPSEVPTAFPGNEQIVPPSTSVTPAQVPSPETTPGVEPPKETPVEQTATPISPVTGTPAQSPVQRPETTPTTEPSPEQASTPDPSPVVKEPTTPRAEASPTPAVQEPPTTAPAVVASPTAPPTGLSSTTTVRESSTMAPAVVAPPTAPTAEPNPTATVQEPPIPAPAVAAPTAAPPVEPNPLEQPLVAPIADPVVQKPEEERLPSVAPVEQRSVAPMAEPSVVAPTTVAPPTATHDPLDNGPVTPPSAPVDTEKPVDGEPPTPAPESAPQEEMLTSASTAAKATSIFTLGGVVAAAGCSVFASTGATSGAAQSAGLTQSATSSVQSSSRVRAPSATMSLVLIGQIQFLATLSLVESTGADDSWILDFAKHLRWVNLWPPEEMVESYTPVTRSPRLEDTDDWSVCELAPAGSSEIGALVFIGNLVLFVVILLVLVLLHILMASSLEAFWVTKQRAKEELEMAQIHGTPICELVVPRWTKRGVRPDGDYDSLTGTKARGFRRQPRMPSPSSSALRRRSGYKLQLHNDEEKASQDGIHSESRLSVISDYRDVSTSAWLHFPHVELVFLLFAFEGAIAAGASALRESRCLMIIAAASVALLLYPILMVIMVCRTIHVRVRSDDLIAFEPTAHSHEVGEGDGAGEGFLFRVIKSCKKSRSLLSWADAGQWVTAKRAYTEFPGEDDWAQRSADDIARRQGDRFRIGFEPLFVDFTKAGSWFMIYSLVQSAMFAAIGVLIDESVTQLFCFCGQLLLSCIVLVLFKPFANRFINTVAVCLSGADAVCMAVLAVAALKWKGTDKAKRADNAVIIIQLMVLVALILPMYFDFSIFIIGGISKLMRKKAVSRDEDDDSEEKRSFIRRYILGAWGPTWCSMLRKNMLACVQDTSEGVRRPRTSTATSRSKSVGRMVAAPTWPNPGTVHST